MKASDFLFKRAQQLHMEHHGKAPSAHGGLKEPEISLDIQAERIEVLKRAEEWKMNMNRKLALADTTNDRLDRIEKAISEITGAKQVEAIYEYANGLKNDPCSWAGVHYERELLPKHLQLIIGRSLYCEMLCGIVQEWAKLKGYEPRRT